MINQGGKQRKTMPEMITPKNVDSMAAAETSTILWNPVLSINITSIFERTDFHGFAHNLPQFIPLGLDD
jgi:hypothetical protein